MDAPAVLALSLALERDIPAALKHAVEELGRLKAAVSRAGFRWEGGDLLQGHTLTELHLQHLQTLLRYEREIFNRTSEARALLSSIEDSRSLSELQFEVWQVAVRLLERP
jgi:bacterioferritin (cytochrome b1)